MKKYLVGGAVRDELLGVANSNTENDWVVVGSTQSEMLELGYMQVGKEFPVFLHPQTKEEYALARLERKVGLGYKGFEFDTSKAVTLEQDLSRRDLTINAIAKDKIGEIVDPFGGREDIDNGLLRHVSEAFSEDPVRVLRIARFAARFKEFGFNVAHETHKLMQDMVASGEVDALTPERVFKELEKSLSYTTPSAFFKVLLACGAYSRVFPGLKDIKHEKHINGFEYLDNLNTSGVIKFALWLKDETQGAITNLCKAINCPKEYSQLALLVNNWQDLANNILNRDKEEVLEFFLKTDAFRRKDRFESIVRAFEIMGIDTSVINKIRQELENIDISSLDKNNMKQEIYSERLKVVELFLNSAK